MEALIYILLYLSSDVLVEGYKILLFFFCGSYLFSQVLISYCAIVNREESELLQQLQQTGTHYPGLMKNTEIAFEEKEADSSEKQTLQLTNEERALGKKIIQEARK